ncbi:hypothetical protein [Amycolatopsis sp. cmx-11-12]|uniref:hypothetical protein n=1 Tax=Amycolatopsis sp. cmx-11-12 TaxID=2785795 RepID=UPI0039180899
MSTDALEMFRVVEGDDHFATMACTWAHSIALRHSGDLATARKLGEDTFERYLCGGRRCDRSAHGHAAAGVGTYDRRAWNRIYRTQRSPDFRRHGEPSSPSLLMTTRRDPAEPALGGPGPACPHGYRGGVRAGSLARSRAGRRCGGYFHQRNNVHVSDVENRIT